MKLITVPKKTGFLKDKHGNDIIVLPDEDGMNIVFDKRVVDARCYVSEDNSRAVLATPWGNIIIRILEEKKCDS